MIFSRPVSDVSIVEYCFCPAALWYQRHSILVACHLMQIVVFFQSEMPEASNIVSLPFLWLVCYVVYISTDAVRYRMLYLLLLFFIPYLRYGDCCLFTIVPAILMAGYQCLMPVASFICLWVSWVLWLVACFLVKGSWTDGEKKRPHWWCDETPK